MRAVILSNFTGSLRPSRLITNMPIVAGSRVGVLCAGIACALPVLWPQGGAAEARRDVCGWGMANTTRLKQESALCACCV